MPKLQTQLHVKMLKKWKDRRAVRPPAGNASQLLAKKIYGLNWGDPERDSALQHVRDHFLQPYVSPQTSIVEIGPGGGRWTRYMLDARRIYALDYHQELLDELKSNFDASNITYIRNDGDNFPGIPCGEIDLVFSFGTFVHLDREIIDSYLKNMKPILNPSTNVIIHYSDKTKPDAQKNPSFSDNDPEKMRLLVASHEYEIREEDTETLWHSSIVRFGLPAGK